MWEAFFRLTKKKIIISLIIILLLELVVFEIGYGGIVVCEPCVDTTSKCAPCRSFDSGITLSLITFVPVMILVYFIVCLVSFLFKTVNEKKTDL